MKKDEEMLNWVSQYLKNLRKAKGWTLEECEQHGWHDWKYLQKIENGQNITLLTFFKLCDLYGVDLRLALEKTSSKRREEKRREEKRREEKRREEKRREETLNGIFSENFVSNNPFFGKNTAFSEKLAILN